MKTWSAKFWRVNPQLRNGGYFTTRMIEAVSRGDALEKARKLAAGCLYGGLELIDVSDSPVEDRG